MHDSVEDGIGNGSFFKDVKPFRDGQLACNNGCFFCVPVFNDFQEV